jgi:hypothetical protein
MYTTQTLAIEALTATPRDRSQWHAVEAQLALIPPAKRDLITAWLWMHVGAHECWTLDSFEHAVKVLSEQSDAVDTRALAASGAV